MASACSLWSHRLVIGGPCQAAPGRAMPKGQCTLALTGFRQMARHDFRLQLDDIGAASECVGDALVMCRRLRRQKRSIGRVLDQGMAEREAVRRQDRSRPPAVPAQSFKRVRDLGERMSR